MPDPAKTTTAQIRYEIRVIPGPFVFKVWGIKFDVPSGKDIVCLVRMILNNRMIEHEEVVGVVGGDYQNETKQFIRLREFLSAGGVVGLNRDIA